MILDLNERNKFKADKSCIKLKYIRVYLSFFPTENLKVKLAIKVHFNNNYHYGQTGIMYSLHSALSRQFLLRNKFVWNFLEVQNMD